ncbi:hypothetical protein ASAP_3030 [Asaia bogorensis]|uniref:Uncharacterized protein n=1 Tax=Asaia bogorensis TaxID=91915 RepID=A0A060QJF0_9PROT|nr:hypothetical protein ASAP_3030 [Asaia bogorensis]
MEKSGETGRASGQDSQQNQTGGPSGNKGESGETHGAAVSQV